jgi:pimeloyl-ACP methyl ester carboxylesterase
MFKGKKVTLGQHQYRYWEQNPEAKETIVILHGFPGNHRVVQDMARHLGTCRILIPDLPACGQSDSLPDSHTLQHYAVWLEQFLQALSIDHMTLIGYSFGSRVAITFTEGNSEMVNNLVLVTPVVRVDGFIARIAALEYEIGGKLPTAFQKTWLANPIYHGLSNLIIFKTASKKRRQYLIDNDKREVARLDAKANLELFQEFFTSPSIALGNQIPAKTLIIAGEKDEIATVSSVAALKDKFPNATMEVVKGAGHVVIAEKPKTVADLIRLWQP